MKTTSAETSLVRTALALGADAYGGPLSIAERELCAEATCVRAPGADDLDALKALLSAGEDPLGDRLVAIRSQIERRGRGQVFTPAAIVHPMVDWVLRERPARVVDAGAGSGRFTFEVLRRNAEVEIIAIDNDPVATLLLRAGLAHTPHRRVSVQNVDYTSLDLPAIDGRTAFLGNPPYIRHHALTPATKDWAYLAALRLGLRMSGLAGLHAYFYLATAAFARPGDVGCFVTSAEWLDVNYGEIIRTLLLNQLGGDSVHLIEPTALPFEGTATTAAIAAFRVGTTPSSLRFRRVPTLDELDPLEGGRRVSRDRLAEAHRWSPFTRGASQVPDRYVELGELCRVHRGAVTGANAVWVVSNESFLGLPSDVAKASVTRARELFAAGDVLLDSSGLRRVIDLPVDLDEIPADARPSVERFLRQALLAGAADGYVAKNRRAWWSVGLKEPAPILATYMARRPPTFVMNAANARHINIAHGLYPRVRMSTGALERLAASLRSSISVHQGRTYAGGLTKFEPREMERLLVPDLPYLEEGD